MRCKWRKIILLILIVFLISLPLQLVAGTYLPINLGVFAYVLFMADSIIGLRPKWLEKFIDLQNLYMAHGIIAIICIALSVWHMLIGNLGNEHLSILTGQIAVYGSIVLSVLAFFFLTNQAEIFFPKIKKGLMMIKNKFLSREVNYYLHMLFPVLVLLVFIHVISISWIKTYWDFYRMFLLYSLVFFAYYIYEGIYKKLRTSKYQITAIKNQGFDVYELVIEYVSGKVIDPQGGQFVFIHSPEAKIGEYHPFSLLSIDDNGKKLTFGIKVCGDYTDKLAKAKKGEIVKIRGVYGQFVRKSQASNVVAIGGGVGIVPCISLLQSLPENTKAKLIWGVNSEKEAHIFKEIVDKLKKTHPDLEIIVHSVDEKGFLNAEYVKGYASDMDMGEVEWYVCGPIPMMKALNKDLKALNISLKKIEAEGFIF